LGPIHWSAQTEVEKFKRGAEIPARLISDGALLFRRNWRSQIVRGICEFNRLRRFLANVKRDRIPLYVVCFPGMVVSYPRLSHAIIRRVASLGN
jgi:hypothetical protein